MTSIQGIYIALYGRPADPAGLAYYTAETNGGTDLSAIGDLSSVTEYQDRFADMSSTEIVTSIYESLFERAPDAEGLAFYVSLLEESSANINRIAIDILNGAQNEDLATINAKIEAADLFTMHLDTDAEVAAYQGNDAADIGRAYIDSVNADDEGTGDEADSFILQLFSDEGQQPGEGGGNGGGSAPDSGAGPDTQNPVLTSSITATIKENSGDDTPVYTATATDNRAVDHFEITGGTDAAAFSINEDTGEVTIDSSPDFEAQDSYSFDITVFDTANNSTTETVTLSITNVAESFHLQPDADFDLAGFTFTSDKFAVDEDDTTQNLNVAVDADEYLTISTTTTNSAIQINSAGNYAFVEFNLGLHSSADLSASETGSELFEGLRNSDSSLSSINVSFNWEGYLIAYDDGDAYIYHADAAGGSSNSQISASEVSLVATIENVGVGQFNNTDFTVFGVSA